MKSTFQNSNHLTPKKMKLKQYPILAFLALMLSFTACQEIHELLPQGANSKKNSKVLVQEIATGAVLKGTNGINFGPDGNLYIASFLPQEIIVMNKQNGKILKKLGPADGVISPDDLVFGPDGSLYWTDINIGEVGRMTPEGVVTKQPVAPGVNPITFSEDGRLFVGLCFLGDGLYELDPDLLAPPRPIIVASAGNEFPLGFLNAFDFGADGMLYGPIFAGGIVVKVDIDRPGPPSTSPYTDGTVTVISTGFTVPVAAKFDSQGVLHVLDQSGEVFKVNTVTGEKTLFATIQPGLDNLAFDSNGSLFISNADFGSIVQILPSGQPRTISKGGMISPMGLAVLPGANKQDALFVADLFRLRKFNGLTGKEENIYKGDLLGREGNLTTPFTLSADGNNLIVSSWFGGVVQIWDPQSDQVVQTFPVGAPIDAIRFKNDIAVSDLVLGGVIRASDQSMILPIDNANVFAPSGLATDGETLWVADWGTGIIWQIGFEGDTPIPAVPIVFGLMNPEGLAWDSDGTLVVVESGASRLSRIDLATGTVSKIADGLKLSPPAVGLDAFPPTYAFDGVAIGQSGDIYVSGGGKNVIYRISKN
jgi:sugar lactone lactonase YvrE